MIRCDTKEGGGPKEGKKVALAAKHHDYAAPKPSLMDHMAGFRTAGPRIGDRGSGYFSHVILCQRGTLCEEKKRKLSEVEQETEELTCFLLTLFYETYKKWEETKD